MLIDKRLDCTIDKIQVAVDRIKMFEQAALNYSKDGYYVAYSGGKDSIVVAELAKMAGVKYEIANNHTTVDPPELVYFVRDQFKKFRADGIKCTVNMPKESMWKLIQRKHTPPTRIIRYCCEVLKEGGGEGRFVITGVRWAESNARRARSGMFQPGRKDDNKKWVFTNDNDEAQKMLKQCSIKNKVVLNPIIDWEDDDVWQFIRERKLDYCKLYDEGFKRLGCIGCPMAGEGRKAEFERYPSYKRAYIRAMDKMLVERDRLGMKPFLGGTVKTGQECFNWWMGTKIKEPTVKGQMEIKER